MNLKLNADRFISLLNPVCLRINDFVRLSKESGISRTTLSYIYNGKLCKPATAGKLAKALGVPVEELIEERSNR